jgi:hypothetical protein
MPDVLQSALTAVGLAIARLGAVKTPQQGVEFFRQLGYEFPPTSFGAALPTLAAAAGGLTGSVGTLAIATDGTVTATASLNLMTQLRSVIQAIEALRSQLQGAAGAVPNIADLPRRLTDFLILDYVATQSADTHEVLHLLGLIEHEPTAAPGQPARLINWNRFGQFLQEPGRIVNDVYGWDTAFDAAKALGRLAGVMRAAGLPGGMYPQSAAVQAALGASAALPELRLPLLSKGLTPATFSQFGITFSPAPAQGGQKAGLALLPFITGGTTFDFEVCDRGQLTFESTTDIRGVGIVIRPPFDAQGLLNLVGAFHAAIRVREKPQAAKEIILVGSRGGTRLSLQGLGINWFVDGSREKLDLGVEAAIDAVRLVIASGEGDGFLQKMLSGVHVEAQAALGFGMSLRSGFKFRGGGNLELDIGVHLNAGPVKVDALRLALQPTADALVLETGAALKFDLGPMEAVVENIGLRSALRFTPGNVGPADLDVSFMPPNGVGLSIDGGGFTGAGFLRFEAGKGEYSGALELTFAGFISVRAVGVLSTRLPDGRDSFSLIIIIVSEFVPIQLSYGFTLLGVGGLLGLNRTVELDALQVGVRDGTLNSILFPTDVVANAPRIISDLKRVFPPHEDRFLIGPMGKLGWGTPTLISVEIGLILEIPRPAFAILGVLRVQLPFEEFGTIYLQVNFAGSVDFEKGQLQFDASLYNSRVLISPLTGDMALRIYWGGDPNFLLTVGGFHPAYTPPPMNIGTLSRLGLVITPGIPSVTAEIYFAVTSNTVQFGARVEILYGVKGIFNVFGNVGLDVLIQFNPFMFVAEISAMFGVRAGSTTLFAIEVTGTLKGPTPWHVRGEASFRIGFIIKVRISANFEVTSGESRNTMLPAIDVLKEIGTALDKAGNWRAVLPRASNQHVSLRDQPTTGDALVLHPFGALEISQKVVPLNIAIQRIGASRPDRGSVFRIAAAQINGVNVATTVSTEEFAPGQFFDLDDATKLSRPSFARYDAGIVIGADTAPQTDFRRERDVTYEVKYVPEAHPLLLIYFLPTPLQQAFARGGAAAQSTLSQAARAPSAVAAEHVSVAPETYAVVSTLDMTLHAAPLVFDNATAADQAMARLIAEQPELTGAVQVVPLAQVRRAA